MESIESGILQSNFAQSDCDCQGYGVFLSSCYGPNPMGRVDLKINRCGSCDVFASDDHATRVVLAVFKKTLRSFGGLTLRNLDGFNGGEIDFPLDKLPYHE